ncbi:MAG TPA: XRE family transcriptional regulator [Streptomyces sp.]|nr:XRE family transcriptional regulator [Streptomyces sp.]
MPRGERPLDAEDGPLREFAADLRKLRQRAGNPTYRELARRAHYAIGTLSGAAAGRHLPTLAVTLAYVRACGGDEEEWELRWRGTATACAPARPAGAGRGTGADEEGEDRAEAPYVGLAAFRERDADVFFGREELTARIVEHLERKRLLVLFGASGSGKSSVLRAGVLPRFSDVPPLVFTPGPHPLEECAIRLAARAAVTPGTLHTELAAEPRTVHRTVRQILAARPGPDTGPVQLLVVVDQFEEVFTLCRDAEERQAFVAALLHAARDPYSRTRVALAVRSDFYTHCTRLPGLVDALADAHVPVGPMTPDELRAAIVRPAARAALTVEGALLAALTAEAHGRPGALPLLSHALLETWGRRRGNALTLDGYRAAGGFEGALAQTAEAFHGALSDTQRVVARRVFPRLVALGEGTEDTKRRVARRELDDTPDTAHVLEQATRARLLTLDRDHVEITHEALIRCWPRLGGWLGEDRDQMRRQRTLTEATAAWEALGRDPDSLYRGVRLAGVRDLPRQALTARERAFLDAGEAAEAERRLRGRRQVRRLRRLVAALVVLLVCVVAAAGFAVDAQRTVARQRTEQVALRAAEVSRRLSAHDTSLAVQVALAAYREAPGPRTRDALLSTLSVAPPGRMPTGHTPAVTRDGRTLAVDDGRSVVLWDMTEPRHPRRRGAVAHRGGGFSALAFHPRRHTLIGVDTVGTLHLWDVTDPRHPRRLAKRPTGHTEAVYTVAVNGTGSMAATSSYDDTVRLWDTSDTERPRPLGVLTGHTRNVKALAFAPDGRTLASGSDDRTIRIWDVTAPRTTPPVVLRGHRLYVDALAYSPDGRTLLSGSDDRTARLWDVGDLPRFRRLAELPGHTDVVASVSFAPDGRTAVTVGVDGALNVWDVTDRAHPDPLAALTNPAGSLKEVRHLPADGAVVTATAHWNVQVWYTDLGHALAHACDHVGAPLSRAEWADHFPGLGYAPPCPGRPAPA